MNDTKILQTIVDSIASLRKEMLEGFKRIDDNLEKVHERLDKQGEQLAYLEDDAPTREEFDQLENRVKKLEGTNTSN